MAASRIRRTIPPRTIAEATLLLDRSGSVGDAIVAERYFIGRLRTERDLAARAECLSQLLRSRIRRAVQADERLIYDLYYQSYRAHRAIARKLSKTGGRHASGQARATRRSFVDRTCGTWALLEYALSDSGFPAIARLANEHTMEFRREWYRVERRTLRALVLTLFRLTSRYGHSLWRIVVTAGATVALLGGALYAVDTWITPSIRMLPEGSTPLEYLTESGLLVATLGFDNPHAPTTWHAVIVSVGTFGSYVLLGLVTYALRRRFEYRDRGGAA